MGKVISFPSKEMTCKIEYRTLFCNKDIALVEYVIYAPKAVVKEYELIDFREDDAD